MKPWNSLPAEVVTESSVRRFEDLINFEFNFKEKLRTWIDDLSKEDNCILRPEYTCDDDDDNDNGSAGDKICNCVLHTSS